ncbi:hypothetical protein Tco_0799248 [Tanacetum coccineum]
MQNQSQLSSHGNSTISMHYPMGSTKFVGLAVQKFFICATISGVHSSTCTSTCFIVASISIVPVSLMLLNLADAHFVANPPKLIMLQSSLYIPNLILQLRSFVVASSYGVDCVPLNLLRGGNKSTGSKDNVVAIGVTAADGDRDDTLHLLRSGDADVECGEFDNGDKERDLLRDGPDGRDDGADDDHDDDENTDDDDDDNDDDGDPDDEPDNVGGGAAIH